MADQTAISWCDHTFNPWMGCTKVSPACKFCYAERDFDHRYHKVKWGASGTRVVTSDAYWKRPLKWSADAAVGMPIWNDGKGNLARIYPRPRVFCASLADVFEEWDGPIHNHNGQKLYTINGEEWFTEGEYPECRLVTMDDVRRRLFELIDSTPNLDWLLLTKRPENVMNMWRHRSDYKYIAEAGSLNDYPMYRRDNVWIGTSVENQEYADKRIPELLKCRDLSPVLFLSCEPLLGQVNLRSSTIFDWCQKNGVLNDQLGYPLIDWVIAGGESGTDARPSHPEWFRSLRDQCFAAGVPFHFKQWGEWQNGSSGFGNNGCMLVNGDLVFPDTLEGREAASMKVRGKWNRLNPTAIARVGVKKAGRELDGVTHDAFPQVNP